MKLSVGSVLLACAFGSLALPLTQNADASLEAREIDTSLEGEQLVSREYEEALAAHYARFSIDDDLEERDLLGEDVTKLDARSDFDEFDLEVRSEFDELDLEAREFEELDLDARDLEAFSELSELERRALLGKLGPKLLGPAKRVISAIRPGGKKGVSLPRSSSKPKKPSASPAKRSGSGKKPAKSGKGGSLAKPKKSASSKKSSKKGVVPKSGKGKGSKGSKKTESKNKKSDKKDGKKKKRQGKNGKGSGKGKGKGGKGDKPKRKPAIRNLNLNIDPASIVAAGAGVANVILG